MATGRIPTTANSPLTAKGDLFTFSTGSAKLAVGSNGDTLVADSSAATGLRWQGDYAAGKNKIINGDFGIWQRGTSFSADGYTADRFALRLSGATASVSRQSFTVGQTDVAQNPTYFLRLAVTTGDNACRVETLLEDVTNSSSKTFTISFWAKGTNPAGGSLEVMARQEFGSGGSTSVNTSAGTIILTASWQRFTKTFTYPSISGKTLGANNCYGIDIRQPASDTGVAGWTLDIANIQLEASSTASDFQTATGTIQGELAACQRYYYRVSANSNEAFTYFGFGVASSTTNVKAIVSAKATLRTAPATVDYSGTIIATTGDGNTFTITSITIDASSAQNPSFNFVVASGLTGNRPYNIRANNDAAAYVGYSAEL